MLGAGAFTVMAPAADAAGGALLLGLVLASAVAYCNAASTARLAALHPRAGGAYVHGRRHLGETWGFLAGWGFVAGKTASCAAVALALGAYVTPGHPRPVAVAAIAVTCALNLRGIERTARVARVTVVLVLLALALAAAAALLGGRADAGRLAVDDASGPLGVLRAGGLFFFAFAGYARIATLGEEVRDPARVIPRAVLLALGVALLAYLVVTIAAQAVLGPDGLAASATPLVDAARAGSLDGVVPLVRAGAVVACFGVLLSLLAGVSRTTLAMARDRELPGALAAVHPLRRVPHRAELAITAVVVVVVLLGGLRGAIGFSAFTVLVYYAVANASVLAAGAGGRRRAAAGLAGCLVLAVSLPPASAALGAGCLALGLAVRAAVAAGRR